MNKDRTVLHIDLNAFYASVECYLNPGISDKPVVVGGDAELRRGIVLAKNEHAKKYGIITGEAVWQAKNKCPHLVFVKPNYDQYIKFSRMAREIYERYTDQIEPFGIDEVWADVTGSRALFGSGKTVADEIRGVIKREMGITASVGVSFNKIFAKLGSDLRKPDFTSVISKENFREVAWRLPASDLLYVGPVTAKKLAGIGIYTIGQLACLDMGVLVSKFGKWGVVLHRFANGEDDSAVAKAVEESFIKSVGNSTTLPRDITSNEEARRVFYMLAESVAARLREHGLMAQTVQIYVRDNTLVSFERQASLSNPSCLTAEIAEKAYGIYMEKYRYTKPIRSLGVRGCNLISRDCCVQLDLYGTQQRRDKITRAEEAVDKLRGRFGHNIVKRGILCEDVKLTGGNPKEEHTIGPVGYFRVPLCFG